jgi:hypothetical protein
MFLVAKNLNQFVQLVRSFEEELDSIECLFFYFPMTPYASFDISDALKENLVPKVVALSLFLTGRTQTS